VKKQSKKHQRCSKPDMQNIWLYVHFPELAIEAVLLDMDKLPIDKPIAISSPAKKCTTHRLLQPTC
jgi:hypothetical protein